MAAPKKSELCRTCQENAPMVLRRKHLKECEECRRARIVGKLQNRKSYRALKGSLNLLVEYYDSGWRYGYMTLLTHGGCAIQPLGSRSGTLPRSETYKLTDVKPVPGHMKPFHVWLEERKKLQPVKVLVVDAGNEVAKAVASLLSKTPTIEVVQPPVTFTKPEQPKTVNSKHGAFDSAEAVRLHLAGTRMKDIVEALRGNRAVGHTGNLVRKALREAKVYQEKTDG